MYLPPEPLQCSLHGKDDPKASFGLVYMLRGFPNLIQRKGLYNAANVVEASEVNCILAILGVARMPALYRRRAVYEVYRVYGDVSDD